MEKKGTTRAFGFLVRETHGMFYGYFNASWLKTSKHKSMSLPVSSPVSVLAYFRTAVTKGEKKVKTFTWWLSNVLQGKMDEKEDAGGTSVTADQWLEILQSRLFWLSRLGLCSSLNSSVIFIDMNPPTLTVDSPGVTTSLLTLTPSRESPTCDLPGDQPVENHSNSACCHYTPMLLFWRIYTGRSLLPPNRKSVLQRIQKQRCQVRQTALPRWAAVCHTE